MTIFQKLYPLIMMCHTGLKSVYLRLQKDPQLRKEYDAIIQEQLKSGIIEKIPEGTENKANCKYVNSDAPSIVQLRMKRLPFGLTSSPAIFGGENQEARK